MFPFGVFNNYNFAIARVRIRGTAGPAGQALNTKVFFRMWSTQTADTGFDPNSTYRSHTDSGHPHWPLPAADSHTIPFFATGNSPNFADPNNPEYGTNGVNNRTVSIASGNTAWAYFGCFLNVFDGGNVVNGAQVQALLAGTHHCIVAQLAYDDAPIVNANGLVASPESSDKLAQRNLQVTLSDNPGPAESHRIPQTFDLKPGTYMQAGAGALLDYPDELMIDWGRTPVGSIAHIYWPQINAMTVLQLANRLYGTHLLSASDSHTIDCTVTRGVTYVPIPPGTGENFAGLFTVDLPTTVTTGQEYDIIVRRVASRRVPIDVPNVPEAPRIAALGNDKKRKKTAAGEGEAETAVLVASRTVGPAMRNWRYVVGTFQVKIPVTTGEVMLRPEENTLAIMKWRLQQLAPSNRWVPVLQRYIGYIAARIDGLGGDSTSILPSPNGVPVKGHDKTHKHEFTGKVCEVIFDCSGDFEGFVIGDCGHRHTFKTREPGIAEIILRACKERLRICVYVDAGCENRICKLVIRC